MFIEGGTRPLAGIARSGRGFVVRLRAPGVIRTFGPYWTQAEAQAVLEDAIRQYERGRL